MVRQTDTLSILVLEDNQERRDAMAERLQARLPQYELLFAATSAECIDWLHRKWSTLLAISLDHDLEPISLGHQRWMEAGTGLEVAEFLSEQTPICPIIIPSTNVAAATQMSLLLQAADWPVSSVVPYGDVEWVSQVWFPALREAMHAWARNAEAASLPISQTE